MVRALDEGKIARVRIDAEALHLRVCQRALDEAYSVIHDADALVFPREASLVEEVFESKARQSGATYYVGRRVIAFDDPVDGFPVESVLATMAERVVLSSEERLRRLEMDARVGEVSAERRADGVWTVRVRGIDFGDYSGQGGSLSAALTLVDRQLGYLAPGEGIAEPGDALPEIEP